MALPSGLSMHDEAPATQHFVTGASACRYFRVTEVGVA